VQEVAIKRLKQTMYEKFATEFEKEFSIMVQLKHENIVGIVGQFVERMSVSVSPSLATPCELRGCKNRPTPFPALTSVLSFSLGFIEYVCCAVN